MKKLDRLILKIVVYVYWIKCRLNNFAERLTDKFTIMKKLFLAALVISLFVSCEESKYRITQSTIYDPSDSFHCTSVWQSDGEIISQYTIPIEQVNAVNVAMNLKRAENLVNILEGNEDLYDYEFKLIDPAPKGFDPREIKDTGDSSIFRVSNCFYKIRESDSVTLFKFDNDKGIPSSVNINGYIFVPVEDYYLVRKNKDNE